MDKCIRVCLNVYRAAGGSNDDNGLSDCHDSFDKLSLSFGESEIVLISGGELVSGISLFALDACVKSYTEDNDV